MRILIAQFQQETNSFSPVLCGIEMFKQTCYIEGDAILAEFADTATELNGFIRALTEAGADIVPSIAAHSVSSGPVTQDVFERITERVAQDLESFGPVDGMLFCFHGAMLLEPNLDATGIFLERIRSLVGDQVVIGGTLDLHANVTPLMVETADILVGYHTFPHVDLFETGYRTAQLLLRTLRGEIVPTSALVKIPMILNGENGQTTKGPMKEIIDKVWEAETHHDVLAVSVFSMQPWLDIADPGCAVLAVTNCSPELASEVGHNLAQEFWAVRERMAVSLTPLAEAVDQAIAAERGPVIFADSADGTGSGSPGDSTAILHELVQRDVDISAYITVVDPETVAQAIEAGVGSSAEFAIGGKIDPRFHQPVLTRAVVKLISDGRFIFKGPQFTGREHQMGRTVVLQIRKIQVVVMEKSAFNWDPSLYRSVGLEPMDARIVVVKSPAAFRVNYEEMASAIYWVDTPGASSAKFLQMPFTQLPKPLFPFQRDFIPDIEVTARSINRMKKVQAGGVEHG
ncbi:MAG: hypothetical protein K0R67_108 [Paenibacillus sp.]|nr:hypothetical protein [Paenibacillus sp.]